MIDTIVVVADRNVECMTFHNTTSSFLLLEQGRKIEALNISPHVGGGGANAAVAMQRLGANSSLLAAVGDDLNAKKAFQHFEQEAVECGLIKVCPEKSTGTSVLISSHDQNAAVFTHRGANTALYRADIDSQMFHDCNLLHIAPLSDESADCFPELIRVAKEGDTFISVNPGVRQLTSRCEAFFDTLSHVDLLSINSAEAEHLIPYLLSHTEKVGSDLWAEEDKLSPLLKEGFRFGGFELSLPDFMRRLHALGPDYIIVTDGRYGSYLFYDERLYFCVPLGVEVAGTAGAGDAFVSTLAYCLKCNMSPEEGLAVAALNASSVISYVDTQSGLRSMDELLELSSSLSNQVISWNLGGQHCDA